MSITDQLLRNNEHYAGSFTKGSLPLPPAKRVAVVACMDARLDLHDLLGLDEGDAHVIRNAGGAITEDAIRSLVISQRLLGTREIILIHHTDCGMLTFTDDDFKRTVLNEGWIERYRAMFKGMRDGLTSEAWKRNIRFLGYDIYERPRQIEQDVTNEALAH